MTCGPCLLSLPPYPPPKKKIKKERKANKKGKFKKKTNFASFFMNSQ